MQPLVVDRRSPLGLVRMGERSRRVGYGNGIESETPDDRSRPRIMGPLEGSAAHD